MSQPGLEIQMKQQEILHDTFAGTELAPYSFVRSGAARVHVP